MKRISFAIHAQRPVGRIAAFFVVIAILGCLAFLLLGLWLLFAIALVVAAAASIARIVLPARPKGPTV